jgi:predicted DNA-binding transcriptional regulator AlpA
VGRKVDVDLLVSAVQMAERLGCARPTIYYWMRTDEAFPAPVWTSAGLGMTGVHLWYWPDVAAWHAKRTKAAAAAAKQA